MALSTAINTAVWPCKPGQPTSVCKISLLRQVKQLPFQRTNAHFAILISTHRNGSCRVLAKTVCPRLEGRAAAPAAGTSGVERMWGAARGVWYGTAGWPLPSASGTAGRPASPGRKSSSSAQAPVRPNKYI
eukprot:scaffold70414_cov47-Prasinocladus_malaysianus.AAC.2